MGEMYINLLFAVCIIALAFMLALDTKQVKRVFNKIINTIF